MEDLKKWGIYTQMKVGTTQANTHNDQKQPYLATVAQIL